MANKSETKKAAVENTSENRWDEQWALQYEHLIKYRIKNSKSWPTTLELFPKDNRLGQWVQRQRDLFERKKLSADRLKLLTKIGFEFNKSDERSSHWQTQLNHLKEYNKKNPDKWPYAREEFPKGNRLGLWVWRQRQNHARKVLAKERVAELTKIGFPLALPDNWNDHYKTLKEFRAKNSQLWPKAREEYPEGNRLGLWCHLQRCAFKISKLSEERTSKLNKIGFLWSVKNVGWENYFDKLKEYKKRFQSKWPYLDPELIEDKKLISWASVQRHKKKNKTLDKEKLSALDKLGFRWSN